MEPLMVEQPARVRTGNRANRCVDDPARPTTRSAAASVPMDTSSAPVTTKAAENVKVTGTLAGDTITVSKIVASK